MPLGAWCATRSHCRYSHSSLNFKWILQWPLWVLLELPGEVNQDFVVTVG